MEGGGCGRMELEVIRKEFCNLMISHEDSTQNAFDKSRTEDHKYRIVPHEVSAQSEEPE